MPVIPAIDAACPCGSPRYADCCARWHDGAAAPDAERLMRSRYSAYALAREDYLLQTWHASTRPPRLDLAASPAPRWLGLRVLAHRTLDAAHAEVEFVARWRVGGGPARRLHERSRFVREAGCWYYVDGDVTED